MHQNAVVLTCDEGFLPPALFVAHQIRKQAHRPYDLILIRTDLDTDAPVVEHGDVLVVGAKGRIDATFPDRHGLASPATLARLLVDRLIPGQYQRLLYLDCDIWIGTPMLHRIFDVDLGDNPVAAVRDGFEVFSGPRCGFHRHKADIGMAAGMPYFNAGVMLIDRRRWVAENIEGKALAYISRGRHLEHHDQTALNAALNGRWQELSPRWNWAHAARDRLTREAAPHIVHFIGPSKPWNDRRARYPAHYGEEMQRFYRDIGKASFFRPAPALARARRQIAKGLKNVGAMIYDRREEAIRQHLGRHRLSMSQETITA